MSTFGLSPQMQNIVMVGGLLGLGGYTIKQIMQKADDKKWVKAHPDQASMIKQLEEQLATFGFKFPHKQARKQKAHDKQVQNEGGPSKPGKDVPTFDTQLDPGQAGMVQ
jgi:hypothetical protein